MSKLSDNLELRKDFPSTSFEDWKKAAEKDLKGQSYDKSLITKTYEGIDLQPIYTQENIKENPLLENFPGYNNYVRGNKTEGNLKNGWLVSQELPYYSPREYNEALKYDLERGLTAIYFKPDLATLLSKDPETAIDGETGKGGTSAVSLEDLEECFKDIDLTKHPLFVNGGFSAMQIFALFVSYFRKSGTDMKKLNAAFLSDPFVFAMRTGVTPYDLETAFDEMYNVTKWTADNKLNIKTIGVCGYEYVNAGGSAVQELGYAMASAIDYINQMIKRGLTIDEAAPRFFFTFGISTNYFMEVAKLRAARIVWSNIIDAYKGKEDSKKMFIHSKTSFYNQAKNDIYVNLLRTTTEAFSAVAGGADSIYTSPFDETVGIPDEFSRRLARNTQIVLREESHFNSVIDPAGGSYYVETITAEIAQKAWEIVKSVEAEGGMLNAVTKGIPQAEIEKTAAAKEKDYAKRKKVIVGNNMYANMKEERIAERENGLEDAKNERTEKFKNRKQREVNLKEVNVDFLIDNFLEGSTIGETGKALKRKPAESNIKTLRVKRASEIFEELREYSYSYKDKNGYFPKIFLATMGPLKQHKARADFSRGFFEVGGFDVIYEKGFESNEDAVNAAVKSGAGIVVVCSTDDTYPEIVPVLVKELKDKIKGVRVILAGYPKDMVEAYKQSGVDEFIFMGADVYEVNKKLLKELI